MSDHKDVLKNKILASRTLSPEEKKEWLILLPQMNAEQIEELDKILSINMPPASIEISKSRNAPLAFPSLGGDEGQLKSPVPSRSPLPQTPVVPPTPPIKPKIPIIPSPRLSTAVPFPVRGGGGESNKEVTIPELNFFREASLVHARNASSMFLYLEALMKNIRNLLRAGQVSAEQANLAFEKSPLYRIYLHDGITKSEGKISDLLSSEEFESITDFRAELKKL